MNKKILLIFSADGGGFNKKDGGIELTFSRGDKDWERGNRYMKPIVNFLTEKCGSLEKEMRKIYEMFDKVFFEFFIFLIFYLFIYLYFFFWFIFFKVFFWF